MGAGTYLISNFLGEVSLAWEVTVGVLIVSVTSPYRRRGLLSHSTCTVCSVAWLTLVC